MRRKGEKKQTQKKNKIFFFCSLFNYYTVIVRVYGTKFSFQFTFIKKQKKKYKKFSFPCVDRSFVQKKNQTQTTQFLRVFHERTDKTKFLCVCLVRFPLPAGETRSGHSSREEKNNNNNHKKGRRAYQQNKKDIERCSLRRLETLPYRSVGPKVFHSLSDSTSLSMCVRAFRRDIYFVTGATGEGDSFPFLKRLL